MVPAVCLRPSGSITTAKENVKMLLFDQDGVSDVCSLLAERVAWDHTLCLLNAASPGVWQGSALVTFNFLAQTVLRGSSWPRIVPTLLEDRHGKKARESTHREQKWNSEGEVTRILPLKFNIQSGSNY